MLHDKTWRTIQMLLQTPFNSLLNVFFCQRWTGKLWRIRTMYNVLTYVYYIGFTSMCTAVLIGWDPATPTLPPHLGSHTRALLVTKIDDISLFPPGIRSASCPSSIFYMRRTLPPPPAQDHSTWCWMPSCCPSAHGCDTWIFLPSRFASSAGMVW